MNIIDAINQRTSIRTYMKKPIHKEELEEIEHILFKNNQLFGPFGHSFIFVYKNNESENGDSQKIGTYGVIKNALLYIGGVCENQMLSIIDFGYVFEHIILSLTKNGYNTCWLGGTFKRQHFNVELKEKEIIPAISPVGYAADHQTLTEKVMRKIAKSDNRLPFDHLFFDVDFNPLNKKHQCPIIDCLHMVRKGPSASNKQPWRIVVDSDKLVYHFYLCRTKNYGKFLKYDIQSLDIGIALAHFELGLKHYNIDYTRVRLDDYPLKDGFEYIISLEEV